MELHEAQKPITNSTFFPDPEEQNWITTATALQIAMQMAYRKNLASHFLHELWRNHRTADIRTIPELFYITGTIPVIIDALSCQMPADVALMVTHHRVPLNLGRQFIKSALGPFLENTHDHGASVIDTITRNAEALVAEASAVNN